MYRRRIVDDELDELFGFVPAIALDGVKAVGKTTTALERVRSAVHLDDSARGRAARADPQTILERPRPLLVDEWQRAPEVWDVVRRAVDADRAPSQFLLTGSASPATGLALHSGAGRIGRLRMRPMTLSERGVVSPTVSLREVVAGSRPRIVGETAWGLVDYLGEIVASGLPGLRGASDRVARFELDSYLLSVVDREVVDAGLAVRKPEAMLGWMRAYAAATGTLASYTRILEAATPGDVDKPSKVTALAYRDALTRLWLLDPVPAWQPMGSALTRLGQAPKHHLADPAFAARLLGATVDSLLDGQGDTLSGNEGYLAGQLFDSLATLCIRVAAQAAEARVGHLRTRNGDREIDLVVYRPDGRVVAFEFKLAAGVAEADVRHLHWLDRQLPGKVIDKILINTGPVAYRRPDGVAVIPLALLGP